MARFKKLVIASKILLVAFSSVCMVGRSHLPQKIDAILIQEQGQLGLEAREMISSEVVDLAELYHLDPLLILAVIRVESRFDLKALSGRDARGLMQVRPIVVREVSWELGIDPRHSDRLLTDQRFNLRVGVHYLAGLIRKFGGDIRKALMAYNRGPTIVQKNYGNRPAPFGGYPEKVLKTYRDYSKI